MISKKWILTLVVTPLLIVTVTTTGIAFAQENTEYATQPPALSLVAPSVIGINQPVNIFVTVLGSDNPVEGAEVWALHQPMVRPAAVDVQSSNESKWPYRFLGITDNEGKVTPDPMFEKMGRFFIVATYTGYAPAVHFLNVQLSALTIEAPEVATLRELITIKVTDGNSGEPVAEVDVYDLYRNIPWNISTNSPICPQEITNLGRLKLEPAMKNRILSIKPVTAVRNVEASLYQLEEKNTHLGETDKNGELTIAFDRLGLHHIMAKKDNYMSGKAQIKVVPVEPVNVLAIKGPRVANSDDEVIFTVIGRYSGSPIAGANVYTIQLPAGWSNTKETMTFKREVSSLLADVQTNLEAMIEEYGEYLDTTDENGQITHVFTDQGYFLIIATADGYIPAVSHIVIGNTMLQLPSLEIAENAKSGLHFYQWRINPEYQPGVGANSTSGFDIKQFIPRLKPGVEEGKTRFRLDLKQYIPWLRPDVKGGS